MADANVELIPLMLRKENSKEVSSIEIEMENFPNTSFDKGEHNCSNATFIVTLVISTFRK